MKRLVIAFALALLLSPVAHAKLQIVTTTTDFADLARQIGGDLVDVQSVMKGPENVHNVMAKPTEMLKVNRADLFVHSGLDSEPWRNNLLKGARNPRVQQGKPGNVDMSAGVELIDVPTTRIDRSMGDVHAYGNPHYQLSPANAQRMTATLTRAMADADPANAQAYRANATRLVNELADLHKELRDKLKPYGTIKIATYHDAWKYFGKAFGIETAVTIEPKPAITPSPAEMRRVIESIKEQGIKVVIVETYNSFDQAKYVADAAGARVIVLPDHVNGLPEVDTYQKLFRYDVEQIIEAAKAGGAAPATQEKSDAR
ncbi:MAG: metal ABC transporter substrate-binding protein [Tepidisphaeraceae bacterium]